MLNKQYLRTSLKFRWVVWSWLAKASDSLLSFLPRFLPFGLRVHDRNPPSSMSTALYPLASLSQIERTPSAEDGIPESLEEDLRAYGCKLIHQAGILLKQ